MKTNLILATILLLSIIVKGQETVICGTITNPQKNGVSIYKNTNTCLFIRLG